jgi:hypothetical protein
MVRLAGLEPATPGLEGRCSIRLSYRRLTNTGKNGRGREIRTPDRSVRSRVLYPAELRALEKQRIILLGLANVNSKRLQTGVDEALRTP